MARATVALHPLHILVVDGVANPRKEVTRTSDGPLTVWRIQIAPPGTGALATTRYYTTYLTAVYRLWRALALPAERIRLVHVHVIFPMGLFAYLLRYLKGIPYVITEHYTVLLPARIHRAPILLRKLFRLTGNRAAHLLPVGPALLAAYRNLGVNTPATVVPNVVDPTHFYPVVDRYRPFTFIHVSALSDAAKNVSGIISAFTTFAQRHSGPRLLIVGDGPDRKKLETQARRSVVNARIRFVGSLPHTEVAAVLRRAHALVMFSNYETFSVVLVEALLCGLPVITPENGSRTDWMTPANGRIIPIGDETALCEALEDIYLNYAHYDAATIAASLPESCAPAAVGQRIVDVYDRVVPLW